MKRCASCNEWFDLDEFYYYDYITSFDQHTPYCKSCHNKKALQWQDKNKEKRKETRKKSDAEYNQKNREKRRLYHLEYRKKKRAINNLSQDNR